VPGPPPPPPPPPLPVAPHLGHAPDLDQDQSNALEDRLEGEEEVGPESDTISDLEARSAPMDTSTLSTTGGTVPHYSLSGLKEGEIVDLKVVE